MGWPRCQMLSYAAQFGLEAMTPDNSLEICFQLSWVEEKIDINWAVIILAVSGNYLDERTVFDYALELLDDDSDEAAEQLAMLSFEEIPDSDLVKKFTTRIITRTSLIEWEYGFEQLFFLAVKWISLHWADYEDPPNSLFMLWDDFYGLDIGQCLSYHDFWPDGARAVSDLKEQMHRRCLSFLEEESLRLKCFDFYDPSALRSLDDIFERWSRFNEYDLPVFIQEEHRRLVEDDFRIAF